MSNNTVDRRGSILNILNQNGRIHVDEVSRAFNVSDVTVRNDLKKLEQDGFLKRIHGGALQSETVASDLNLREKAKRNATEKIQIGRAAAAMVQQGDTIILDSGTTTLQLARNIKSMKDITVITNALNIATELAGRDGIEVILTGGILRKNSFSLVGPHAEHTLGEYFGDKLFLGVDGISVKHGVTTPNPLEAQVNRMMVERVSEVIVVTDSSKFARRSLSLIIPINKVHTIITDKGIPESEYRDLEAQSVSVVRVESG